MKRQFGRSTRRFHGMERLHEVVEEEYGKGYRKENRRVEKEERKNKLMKSKKKKKKKNERDGWIVREGRRGVESVHLLREDINNVRTLGEDNSKVKISCCRKMKNRIDGSDEDDEEDEGEEDEGDDDDGDNDGEKNEEKRKEDEEDEGDEEEDVVGGDDDDGEEGNDDGNETIDLKDGYQGYEVKKKELRNGEQANKRFFHRLQALNNKLKKDFDEESWEVAGGRGGRRGGGRGGRRGGENGVGRGGEMVEGK